MIGYKISRKEMEALIERGVPGWISRAKGRTAGFRKQGKYMESGSIWHEVKGIYMKLQGGSKCAYCERKLEAAEYGKGEQAVEHFRPKGKVVAWKLPGATAAQGVRLARTPAGKGGYYLLAYDVFNYAAACIPCNSALKKNYFPVVARPRLNGTRPEALRTEKPLLIYPLGDFDDSPETLIRFHGLSPQAASESGHERHRALVTIEFFQLDHLTRENLIRERATVIITLFDQLHKLAGLATGSDMARQIVDGYTAPHSPHTNCARSFRDLFQRDPAEARTIYELAAKLVASKS